MPKNNLKAAKSFWLSIPGFLTALAGLISAVSGLYVALHSASGDKPKTEAAAALPKKEGLQIVRIQSSFPSGTMISNGFFTPKGYIVAATHTIGDATQVSVTWISERKEQHQEAQVMGPGSIAPEATLLKLIGTQLVPHDVAIRISGSLQPGEKVSRYVGPNDVTPGTVKEVYAQRQVLVETRNITLTRLLITTEIGALGDSGSPVLDSNGKIVGMLYGASNTEAICIPIEDIKASFLEAF